MKITIRKPIGYSQIGRKDQQEDAVWPSFTDVSTENRCIVLCDGVGGSKHGEVASTVSSKVIGEYLTKTVQENGDVTESDIQNAVNLAYDELEKIDIEDSDSRIVSMATTLTCVCLHKDGILAAHMGDSRIYHVRPGQGLLYQSADHSLVNALLQAGELSPEEAKTFPRKNVITKAIQPHAGKRFKAEVHQLIDIKSGDYLFLCCDGVLEQLTNERLVEVLSMKCSDREKLQKLEAESTDRTKDNYTAYLIPIDKVEGESSLIHNDDVEVVEAAAANKDKSLSISDSEKQTYKKQSHFPNSQEASSVTSNKSNTIIKYVAICLLIITISIIAFLFGKYTTNDIKSKSTPETRETIQKNQKDTTDKLRVSTKETLRKEQTHSHQGTFPKDKVGRKDQKSDTTTQTYNLYEVGLKK